MLVSVALRLHYFVCGHVKSCTVKRSATLVLLVAGGAPFPYDSTRSFFSLL